MLVCAASPICTLAGPGADAGDELRIHRLVVGALAEQRLVELQRAQRDAVVVVRDRAVVGRGRWYRRPAVPAMRKLKLKPPGPSIVKSHPAASLTGSKASGPTVAAPLMLKPGTVAS